MKSVGPTEPFFFFRENRPPRQLNPTPTPKPQPWHITPVLTQCAGTYDFRVAGPGVVSPTVVPEGAAQEDHQEAVGELVLSPFRRQAGRRVRPCVRGGLKGRRVDVSYGR